MTSDLAHDAGIDAAEDSGDEEKSAVSFCCTVCHEVINDSRSRSVSCACCKSWSHVKCTMGKEVFDLLSKVGKSSKKPMVFSGRLAYICQGCDSSIDKVIKTCKTVLVSTSSQSTVTDTMTDTNVNSAISTSKETTQNEPEENIQGYSAKSKISETTTPICFYYKSGRCRHGKSGKTLVNGKKCNFLHPPKCIRFCKFGQDKIKGCDGSCKFFHPILCRNSTKYKKCLNENCTFAHLQGTERYRVPSYSRDYTSYSNDYLARQGQQKFNFDPNSQMRSVLASHRPKFLSKSRKEGFEYKSCEFPPLSNIQEDKINALSSAVTRIQSCLEVLMGRQNNSDVSFHQQYPTSNNYPPKDATQNLSQVPLNNQYTTRNGSQHFGRNGVQPMYNQPLPMSEAKN